jgi:hypothetical protein
MINMVALGKALEGTKAGFTGTRWGMTTGQKLAVAKIIIGLSITEVHHGDCVGADADMHGIALSRHGLRIVIHPPVKADLRAFCDPGEGGNTRAPYGYLVRDRHIVDETDILIATSHAFVEEKGGTFYTMNYARLPNVNHIVYWVTPDGGIRQWRA